MPRLILPVTVTTLAVVGLTLFAATPALAFATPPTLTVTPTAQSEVADAEYAGECPVGTGDFTISATLDADSTHQQYDVDDNATLDPNNGLVTGTVNLGEIAPGTAITFTLTCLAPDSSPLGTVDAPYTTLDFGASATAAAASMDAPIVVSGTCGTATGTTLVYFRVDINNDFAVHVEQQPFTGSPFSYELGTTLADIGAKAGDTVNVLVGCFGPDGTEAGPVSIRQAAVAIPVAPGPMLAATGTDATVPFTAALALLAAGAVALAYRRRRA